MNAEFNPSPSSSSFPLSRRCLFAGMAAGAASLAVPDSAEARFSPNQTPTQMSLSLSAVQARRGVQVTATARLTRLDNGGPVQSAMVSFFFGQVRFPNSSLGSRYTDARGVAQLTFWVSQWATLGRNVVVAEFLGNNTFAQPLPFAFVNIVR